MPNGESWKNITVILNAQTKSVKVEVPKAKYQIVANGGEINHLKGLGSVTTSKLKVQPQSAMIVYEKE